jgi:hypothetical protein
MNEDVQQNRLATEGQLTKEPRVNVDRLRYRVVLTRTAAQWLADDWAAVGSGKMWDVTTDDSPCDVYIPLGESGRVDVA